MRGAVIFHRRSRSTFTTGIPSTAAVKSCRLIAGWCSCALQILVAGLVTAGRTWSCQTRSRRSGRPGWPGGSRSCRLGGPASLLRRRPVAGRPVVDRGLPSRPTGPLDGPVSLLPEFVQHSHSDARP